MYTSNKKFVRCAHMFYSEYCCVEYSKLSKVLKHFMYDEGRLSGKFIICIKTLIAIFRLMVCFSLHLFSFSIECIFD